jgi:hypothetical protein
MSTSANATIEISSQIQYSSSSPLGSVGSYSGTFRVSETATYSSATVSKYWANSYTGSSTQTIDVTSITDAFGNALSFATVQVIVIQITSSSGNVVVGGGSNPLLGSDQWTVIGTANGTTWAVPQPYTVSGTVKVLKFIPSTSLTFNIQIVGS